MMADRLTKGSLEWGRSTCRSILEPMSTDEDLIALARRGDEDASRMIFEREHRFIIRFIYGMVGRRDLAEELTQETFMRAFRDLWKLREETKLATWICGIAKNVVLGWLRSHRKESRNIAIRDESALEISGGELNPEGEFLNKELKRVIHNALIKLDESKRIVFILKVLQQLSYEEIAEVTGRSIPKLKTDLHRAKAEMRRRIRPYL
jgi:RNA polymerase sigma-70 factor, ECF subfamily